MPKKLKINIRPPDLQVGFAKSLTEIRKEMLQEALSKAIAEIDLEILNAQLSQIVPKGALSALAKNGLRGEILFPVPCLLEQNPKLLAYYRLLLGYSQKSFYTSENGLSIFKSMEDKGKISGNAHILIGNLCLQLVKNALYLITGIGPENISKELIHELSLLTLGAQLRGGANVQRGLDANEVVFNLIKEIVSQKIKSTTKQKIEVLNAAGRKVYIEFASDPDIIIREEMSKDSYRNIIAIEVKGGKDFSNIHNRIGEAEKSHQKARQSGYVECWTVVNVDNIDIEMSHRESPSTNRFYIMSRLQEKKDSEFQDFCNRIISLAGIPHRK